LRRTQIGTDLEGCIRRLGLRARNGAEPQLVGVQRVGIALMALFSLVEQIHGTDAAFA